MDMLQWHSGSAMGAPLSWRTRALSSAQGVCFEGRGRRHPHRVQAAAVTMHEPATPPQHDSVQGLQGHHQYRPNLAELMRSIKGCRSDPDMLALLPRWDAFTPRHVSAALTHLAQLHARRPDAPRSRRSTGAVRYGAGSGSHGGRDTSAALLLHHRFLCPPSPSLLREWGPREASNTLWAVAKLRLPMASADTQALLDSVLSSTTLPNASDLANAIYACATMGHNPSPAWLRAFEEASLALLQPQHPTALSQPSTSSQQHGAFPAHELCQVLYALALLEHTPSERWLSAFAAASLPLLPLLPPQPLCTITWAASRVSAARSPLPSSSPHAAAAAAAAAASKQHSPTSQPSASPSMAQAWPPAQWREAAWQSMWGHMPNMNWQLLASAIWSASRLAVSVDGSHPAPTAPAPGRHLAAGTSPSSDAKDPLHGPQRHSRLSPGLSPEWMSRFLAASADAVISSPTPASPPAHHRAATGAQPTTAAPVHHSTSQGSSSGTSQPTMPDSFPAHALSNMLCALAELGYRPPDSWMDLQLCASLSPQSLRPGHPGLGRQSPGVSPGEPGLWSGSGSRTGGVAPAAGQLGGSHRSAASGLPGNTAQHSGRDPGGSAGSLLAASGSAAASAHSWGAPPAVLTKPGATHQPPPHAAHLAGLRQPAPGEQRSWRLPTPSVALPAPSLPIGDATSILVSCARLGYTPPPPVSAALLRCTYAGMPSCSPSHLVNVLWAMAKLRLLPLSSEAGHAWLSRFWSCSLPALQHLSVAQLAKALAAVALLSRQHHQQQQQQQQQHHTASWASEASRPAAPSSAIGVAPSERNGAPAKQPRSSSPDAAAVGPWVEAPSQPTPYERPAMAAGQPDSRSSSDPGAQKPQPLPARPPCIAPKTWWARAMRVLDGRLEQTFAVGSAEGDQKGGGTTAGRREVVLQRLGPGAGERLRPQQLLLLLWAVGSGPGPGRKQVELRSRLLAASTAALPSLAVEQLAKLPLLLATCDCRRPHDRSGFQRALMRRVDQGTLAVLTGRQVCYLLSGIAALGCYPPKAWLSRALARLQVPGLLQGTSTDVLCSLLLALRFLLDQPHQQPQPAAPAPANPAPVSPHYLCRRVVRNLHAACGAALAAPHCPPEAPFRLLYPLSRLGCPPDKDAWWCGAYESMRPLLGRMTGKQLANLLYLLATIAVQVESQRPAAGVRTSHQGQAQAQQQGQGQGPSEGPSTSPQAPAAGRVQGGTARVGGPSFTAPPDDWVESAFQQITSDFSSLDARDVARLLCALACFPQSLGMFPPQFQRLNLLIETSSAKYDDADHRLIAGAWLRLSKGSTVGRARKRKAGVKTPGGKRVGGPAGKKPSKSQDRDGTNAVKELATVPPGK